MNRKRRNVRDNPRQCAAEGAQAGHLKESATLRDLFDATIAREPGKQIVRDMLRRTSKHLCNCLGKLPSDIQISQLLEVVQTLRTFLAGKRYGPVTFRRYSNCIRVLIETAEDLGRIAGNAALRRKWREILKRRPRALRGRWVEDWATSRGIDPDHFGAAELKLCAREAVQEGRSYFSVCPVESYLRRLVVQKKLA